MAVINGRFPVKQPSGNDGVASGGEPPYDGDMEARVAKLEADLTAIKIDVAVIKANGATKSDIADVRAVVSEAKTSIIIWSVSAIFLAQLLPSILKLFIK
ncbi:MAG: hypothetical protein H7240_09120 [Glaciimonas sp.]|nr:hypothetical protein [Glaciimonas sp.]